MDANLTPTKGEFAKKTILGAGNLFTSLIVLIVDIALGYFAFKLFSLGYIPLGICFVLIIMMISVAFLVPKAHMFKWMAIGLSAWLLFSIFPIVYTIYNAFTNYGDGHLISQTQAIEQIQAQTYLPETGKAYQWIAYRSEANEYLLWLKDADGNTKLVTQVDAEGEAEVPLVSGENGIGEIDADGAPVTIEGYKRLNRILASTDKNLTNIKFGDPENTIQVRSPSEAAELLPLYAYDPEANTFTNEVTGTVYYDKEGTYTANNKEQLIPGYTAVVGGKNFVQFVNSPGLRGPLVTIVIWNFLFATFSLLLTFSVGLLISIIYGDPKFKGKKILRSLLLIPYTIPSLITILIWRGMFNPDLGVINRMLESVFNISPRWFTEPWLARIALLVVNTWLGYPYWMLVTSGALQSIPGDIYEAAEIDGASGWQQFRNITLPLLLVSVGPLMISSFIFNFNNFNLIYAFINGGPPIPTATTQAGYTDIIISYVYNLAFASGRGVQYGYASAISLVLFMVIAVMSLLQFKFTNMWEEVGENV
ncbi:MAG TPA: ABC transporter permease subunit [Anaerolineaceae bacterium]|nr:ABC transporter permease subunit [Anaerolineaceae bacterium]